MDADAAVQARDEVQLYLDARYVSLIEAYARSMGWATHRVRMYNFCYEYASLTSIQEFPPVKQLQVHLENEHQVTFRPNGEHSLSNLVQDSQLTGFSR